MTVLGELEFKQLNNVSTNPPLLIHPNSEKCNFNLITDANLTY